MVRPEPDAQRRVPSEGGQTAAKTHKRAWGSPWTATLQFWLWKGQLRAVRRTGTIIVPIDLEESKEHYNDLRMSPRYRQG